MSYANDDHIIPPATSRALGGKMGRSDYTELALPGGHVGVFVGGRSQALFAPAVASFVGRHDLRDEGRADAVFDQRRCLALL